MDHCNNCLPCVAKIGKHDESKRKVIDYFIRASCLCLCDKNELRHYLNKVLDLDLLRSKTHDSCPCLGSMDCFTIIDDCNVIAYEFTYSLKEKEISLKNCFCYTNCDEDKIKICKVFVAFEMPSLLYFYNDVSKKTDCYILDKKFNLDDLCNIIDMQVKCEISKCLIVLVSIKKKD